MSFLRYLNHFGALKNMNIFQAPFQGWHNSDTKTGGEEQKAIDESHSWVQM